MSNDVYVETLCGECNLYAWEPEWVPAPKGFEYVADVRWSEQDNEPSEGCCSVCRTRSPRTGWFTAGIVWVNMG